MKKRMLFILVVLFSLNGYSQSTLGDNIYGNWEDSENWDTEEAPGTNLGPGSTITITETDIIFLEEDLQFTSNGTLNVQKDAYLKINGDLDVASKITINVETGGILIILGDIKLAANGTITLNGDMQAKSVSGPSNNSVTGTGNFYLTTGNSGHVSIPPAMKKTGNMIDPYPVELLSFTAKPTPSGVTLNWVTATETNNMGFELQRMDASSGQWDLIGWVDGNYNHNGILNYNFLDHGPVQGVNYYRMRQMDYDGAYKFYGPLAVVNDLSIDVADFKVYKNASTWHIALPGYDFYKVEIYDLAGRSIYSGQAVNNLSFPAPGQAVVIRVFNNMEAPVSRVVM